VKSIEKKRRFQYIEEIKKGSPSHSYLRKEGKEEKANT